MLTMSFRFTARMASVTPSMPAVGMDFGSMSFAFPAAMAPSAISSFWPMMPLIWPGCAGSQFSMSDSASAREQLAVFDHRVGLHLSAMTSFEPM
jgi:hypothetical protein